MDPASIEASVPEAPQGEIIARAGRYYRWTRYLISIGLLIIYGSFFIKDGFFTWPRELQKAQQLEAIGSHAEVKPHSETDIRFQQALGVAMPLLGLALLAWTLYNSRGEYRLSGNTLHIPGHPPVPLESIVSIDQTLWDRKGIAYIEYVPTAAGGSAEPTRTLKLDDFVYDRDATDAIVERIEQLVAPSDEQGLAEADADAPAQSKSSTEEPLEREAP